MPAESTRCVQEVPFTGPEATETFSGPPEPGAGDPPLVGPHMKPLLGR